MKRKLQVFISSTFTDLIEERQAAVAAILKAGHIPAGMELFTAGDKSQMKTIERWIDDSDIYMLILGGRYGSIEPTTGLSYVELEYNYAISTSKPTFAVVITEPALDKKVKSSGISFLERNDPKALDQFREKVLKNISSFFDDPKDIKLCVHESLSDYAANPELKGWISAEDVQETRKLQEEISQLREENASLNEKLHSIQQSSSRSVVIGTKGGQKELVEILSAIEIEIPAKLAKSESTKTVDLLSLVYKNRDRLINGITNGIGASDADQFLYHKVFPKLQTHGLADNEKVAGVKYRRSFLNKKGLEFIAEMDRAALPKKKIASLTKDVKIESTKNEGISKQETPHEPGKVEASSAPGDRRQEGPVI